MKKLAFSLLLTVAGLSCLTLSGCAQRSGAAALTQKADAGRTTLTFDVGEFDALSAKTTVRVVYTPGEGPVRVTGEVDSRWADRLEVKVEDGELCARLRGDNRDGDKTKEAEAVVYVTGPAVGRMEAVSLGSIEATRPVAADLLELRAASMGKIVMPDFDGTALCLDAASMGSIETGAVRCDDLSVDAASMGKVRLSAAVKAGRLSIDAASMGQVDLPGDVRAETASLSVASMAQAEMEGKLRADRLSVDVASSGKLYFGELDCQKIEGSVATTGELRAASTKSDRRDVSVRSSAKVDWGD